jgi:type I restriction enzyme S subunit
MAEHKTTPQIRFKGFSDDWENLKVVDILVERNTQAPKTDEYPLMSFVASYGVVPKGDRYNREFLVNDEMNKKYKQTEFGDFIYSSNNLETGSIGLNNYGKASISPVYSIFQPTEYGVSDFIGRLLIRKSFINQMIRWRQGVIYGQWRIHESDFMQIEIVVPLPKEQAEIGNFLKNLDTLIDLHQRKYDKLIQLKKAMLEKMFPKNGSKAPEIRFTGYNTEPWIQRNFIDIVNRTSNLSEKKTLPRVEYEDIVSGQGILNKDLRKKVSLKKGILFQQGDVLFGKLRPYLKNWILSDFSGIAVGDFWVFRTCETDCKFVYSLIQSNQFQDVVNQSTGTKMPRADWPLVSTATFSIPYTVDEQNKVGTLFLKLDNLINLHQRKYDKLIQLKKAMLEKMFV